MSHLFPNVHVTFHEEFRTPFGTWVLGVMRTEDGRRYALITCMPLRKGDTPPAEWETLANAASVGLHALLLAVTSESRAKITDIMDSFEIGPFYQHPPEITWEQLLKIAVRWSGDGEHPREQA